MSAGHKSFAENEMHYGGASDCKYRAASLTDFKMNIKWYPDVLEQSALFHEYLKAHTSNRWDYKT